MRKAVKICMIILAIIVSLIALSVGIFFILIEPRFNIMNGEQLDLGKLSSECGSFTLLDCDGNPLDTSVLGSNYVKVKIDDIPSQTKDAFIAIEDKRFYSHSGVDYKRVISAAINNLKSFSFEQGASTITQQLIKNTHLSNKKTVSRKLNEMRLARALERVKSKDEILESYFNILYFGSGIRGLGTASRVYFGIDPSELSLAQSAALASIINNPTKFNPYYNIDNLNSRKELVLRLMRDRQMISSNDYNAAISESLHFASSRQSQFAAGAIKSACHMFDCSEKQLFAKNIELKTSYNKRISAVARDLITDIEDCNARIFVLDNKSGGVVCDETNCEKYINPRRSPASTIKPFVCFAPVLESGMTPLDQIDDSPTSFGQYKPKNYKDVYRGYISIADGLAYSSNIVATKLLGDIGVENGIDVAQKFGLPFDDGDNSLAVALGGMVNGVTLPELANAYRTLANGGNFSEMSYIDSGKKKQISRAVNDDTAYLITDMLLSCAQIGTAKQLKSYDFLSAKTGTNGDKNGNYDCYCIAYTPKVTIAVWLGARQNPLPNHVTGATCCKIVSQLIDGAKIDTDTPFEVPFSVSVFDVDGRELNASHRVYLADPLLPRRYRIKAYLSKRFLPIRKSIDLIDWYENFMW